MPTEIKAKNNNPNSFKPDQLIFRYDQPIPLNTYETCLYLGVTGLDLSPFLHHAIKRFTQIPNKTCRAEKERIYEFEDSTLLLIAINSGKVKINEDVNDEKVILESDKYLTKLDIHSSQLPPSTQ